MGSGAAEKEYCARLQIRQAGKWRACADQDVPLGFVGTRDLSVEWSMKKGLSGPSAKTWLDSDLRSPPMGSISLYLQPHSGLWCSLSETRGLPFYASRIPDDGTHPDVVSIASSWGFSLLVSFQTLCFLFVCLCFLFLFF